MKYKAIISDVDGTLVAVGSRGIPTKNVENAIIQLNEEGVTFALASGRPHYLLKNLATHLQLNSPLIVDNGALIVDGATGSVLWEKNLPIQETREIISMIDDTYFMRVSCGSDSTDVLENKRTVPDNAAVRKISVHDITHSQADQLIKSVENKFKNLAVVKATSCKSEKLTDIYFAHAEATKQHAVLHFAKILGISPHEIIGVGDGYNDFSLLMACGLKVAMGNAVPELKAIADYIAPSVEEDGLADVIEKYILYP